MTPETSLHRSAVGQVPSLAPFLSGLHYRPSTWSAAAKAIAGSIAAATALVLIVDGLVFRRSLTVEYVAFYTGPLMPRTAVACVLAAFEEVKFRLVLMTLLVMALSCWRRPLPPLAFIAVILVCQFANVGHLVMADPLYASLRYWAVGCLWGLLYWRHGWLTALIGHVTSHLLLDPLLALVLLHT